jgi:hypothetical protein
MSFECIRYRFRVNANQSCLELLQVAALESLRHSPRCRSWRVLPAPRDPSVLMLAIEWDPGASPTPFRGSVEFAGLHAALGEQVRTLEEADYLVDPHSLRRILGGTETLFGLAEDIVAAVVREPELGRHFESRDGSKRARLGLWLLEVLGGPDLFSTSFPDSMASLGPLSGDRLDLDDRARLLEIALAALPSPADERARCVLGTLRAHLPLHPSPPSQQRSDPHRFGDEEDDVTTVAPLALALPRRRAGVAEETGSHQLARYTEMRFRPTGDSSTSSLPAHERSPEETGPVAGLDEPRDDREVESGEVASGEVESGEVESGDVLRPALRTAVVTPVGRGPWRPAARESRFAAAARRSKRRG